MIKLAKNERVDWFRITVDFNNNGISIYALSKISQIPMSTIKSWRYRDASPRLEEAVRLLNIWSDMTGGNIEEVPTYNQFDHDSTKNKQ